MGANCTYEAFPVDSDLVGIGPGFQEVQFTIGLVLIGGFPDLLTR